MPKEINWEKRFEKEQKEKKSLQRKIWLSIALADITELRFILAMLTLFETFKRR